VVLHDTAALLATQDACQSIVIERMDFVNDRNGNFTKINLMMIYLCHKKTISRTSLTRSWPGCMSTLASYTHRFIVKKETVICFETAVSLLFYNSI
jgi:hypothetical protein